MKYKTFSVRLPKQLVDAIDATARKRFRRGNSRNLLIMDILSEHQERLQQIESIDSELVTTKSTSQKRKSALTVPSGD